MTAAEQLRELTPMLSQLAEQGPLSAGKIKSLRRDYGDDLTRDLLASAELQSKAREKLGDRTWWVTEKSLQQATPWQVATIKAGWFAGLPVDDLCCGIGSDAFRLAQSSAPVVGIDWDERLVRMAAANLSDYPNAAIHCNDVLAYSRTPSSAIHLDPDRRRAGRRSSRPEAYSPNWSQVTALVRTATGSLVKLAPAASPELSDFPHHHRVWISLSGSVREQSLLSGVVREEFAALHCSGCSDERTALIVDRDANQSAFSAAVQNGDAEICQSPHRWMINPDAAIRAAGLTDAFAVKYGLSAIGGPAGFLTGDSAAVPVNLAVTERVLWCGSCDDRQLRRELRSRNAYAWRIKTRGVSIDPAKLEQRLRDCGDQPITLWIGRSSRRQYAVMTEVTADNQSKL